MASQKQVYVDHNGLALVELDDAHRYNLQDQNATDIDRIWIGNTIEFQKGAVKANGLNGWQNEHIVAMLIHRINTLDSLFPCVENKMAIMHLNDALGCLHDRTKNRIERGVEGEKKV